MKKILSLSIALVVSSACLAQSGKLTINGTVTDSTLNGKYVYINDYFANKKAIDSCKVENLKFNYVVDADKFVSLLLISDKTTANIISEEGVVEIKLGHPSKISGGTMNQAYTDLNDSISKMHKDYMAMRNNKASEEELNAAYNVFNTTVLSQAKELLASNIGNNLGLLLLLNIAPMTDINHLKTESAKFGEKAAKFAPLQRVITRKENEEKTKAGVMFVDFAAVNPDGSAAKLSDYVGKGKYVVADFWASWCAPCRAVIPKIKELYEQYKDKGLVVLGVNVWDKKGAFEKAMKDLEIPWAQICSFDNNTPTDLYGINGIPHIILYAPDGTIVERNLHGASLESKLLEIYKEK